MLSKKYLFLAIIFAAMVLTGLSCTKKSSQPTETTTTTTVQDLTNIDPTTVVGITTDLNKAKEKALEWQSDAKLYHLAIKLPSDFSIGNATETFTFGSNKDSNNWWTISLSQKSGKFIRAIIPKEDYLGSDLTAAKLDFLNTNYVKAFQLAETSGGKAFRQKNATAVVTLNLANGQPKGWLWWVVEYKSADGETLNIRIDPNLGQVVDEQGNPITTESTTSGSSTTSPSSSTSGSSSSSGGSSSGATSTPATSSESEL